MVGSLQWLVGALVNEVEDAIDVECDDGFLAFVGLQVGHGALLQSRGCTCTPGSVRRESVCPGGP